jgi:hypothetical protein
MTLRFAALAITWLGVLPAGTQSGLPVASPRLARDPGPRTEVFVLSMNPATLITREVGTVELRRRAVEGGMQLEGEWTFPRAITEGGDERVLHIEQLGAAATRLLWREWGIARARSLVVDRAADAKSLACVDTTRGGTCREILSPAEPSWLPLELLECLRLEGPPAGTLQRFDPLSRRSETVRVRTLPEEASAGRSPSKEAVRREYELAREDGTIAGRFEFRGEELMSFSWQDGDLVARRKVSVPGSPGAAPTKP